jgi:hypothetical protein
MVALGLSLRGVTGSVLRRRLLLCLALLLPASACQVACSISGTVSPSSVASGTVLALSGLSTGRRRRPTAGTTPQSRSWPRGSGSGRETGRSQRILPCRFHTESSALGRCEHVPSREAVAAAALALFGTPPRMGWMTRKTFGELTQSSSPGANSRRRCRVSHPRGGRRRPRPFVPLAA